MPGAGNASAAVPQLELQLEHMQDPALKQVLRAGFNGTEFAIGGQTGAGASAVWLALANTEGRRLTALMKAYGYLDAQTTVSETNDSSAPGEALRVTLTPMSGHPYRIGVIKIWGLGESDFATIRAGLRDVAANIVGQILNAKVLSQFEDQVKWRLRNASRPYPRLTSREVIADPGTHTAEVRIGVDAGPIGTFGAVNYSGLTRLAPQSLLRYVPFKPGDPYQSEKVNELAANLVGSNEFQTVNVYPADALDAKGQVIVEADLREKMVDPEMLARLRSLGIAILVTALAVLALRQMALAGNARPGSAAVIALDLIILIAAMVSAGLVVQRLLVFANVG